MNQIPKISHQTIAAYLRDELDTSEERRVLEAQKDDPINNLLFKVIRKLKNNIDFQKLSVPEDIRMTFEEIEDVLMEILAGQLHERPVQKFAYGLLHSAEFYDRLLLKLSQIGSLMVPRKTPELAKIEIKENDEILINAGILKAVPEQPQEIERISQNGKPGIAKGLKWLFKPQNGFPKPALIMGGVTLAILVGLIFYFNFIQTVTYRYYIYDDKIPYEINSAELRDVEKEATKDTILYQFVNIFNSALGSYRVMEYKEAIKTLEPLDSIAQELLSKSTNDNTLLIIRNYYFYLGLSHLALSQKQVFSDEEKSGHLNKAIRYLSRADSIALGNNLANNDREIYFLGLAYDFAGNIDLAIAQFHKIKPESEFYKDSRKLIRESGK
ncbi:MAG: hypothetical protein CV087_16020 [Candidatus Brocadia sp. WS118]|nr:MAG: hypothetical protein CV087_16020 [Candidatus Brocadia sp. WS118]